MNWLLPAALCSISIALILKVNERRAGSRILIAGANYLVASAISFFMLGSRVPRVGTAVLSLGGAAGIIYVLGFLLLMAGIARMPLAVPVTVARLSVVLPVAVSVLLWAEGPGLFQWLGICFGLAAVVLFGVSISGAGGASGAGGPASSTGRSSWPLVLSLFVVLGLGDVVLKAFRETASDADRLSFTFVLFDVAAVFTWILVAARRIRFDARTFALGAVLGVPNLFSTVFTLQALRTVPASIVFPFINITVIAGTALLALLVWRERPRGASVAGLLAAACAIVLLAMR
ncbi:MAG: EamA family transporter [Candidatus Krumholzibacteria bacterium]|nr:EamA family transporter [Candidatus Krumholzibacteria bacterium]